MSRTPSYNINKLPLWVQKKISDLSELIENVRYELAEAEAQIALRDEEIAELEARAERIAVQADDIDASQKFSSFRVDI